MILTLSNFLSIERKKKIRLALAELGFSWFISQLPIFGAYLVKLTLEQCPYQITFKEQICRISSLYSGESTCFLSNQWECVYSSMDKGEVFIFATASIGSIIVVMNKYNEKSRRFPAHFLTMFAVISILFISTLFYVLYQTSQIINDTFANYVALGVYISVILVWFKSIYDSEQLTDAAALETRAETLNEIQRAEVSQIDELNNFRGE